MFSDSCDKDSEWSVYIFWNIYVAGGMWHHSDRLYLNETRSPSTNINI
jgi:hypothetical protein